MNDKLKNGYRQFFLKTEEGQYLFNFIQERIEESHRLAENDPELSRDYSQRAKASREIIEHINSVMTERRPKTK